MLFYHPKKLCTHCFEEVKPKSKAPGNIAIEFVLWCLFIIPGLIYSLWRISNKKDVCPLCDHDDLVPPESKRGQYVMAQFKKVS